MTACYSVLMNELWTRFKTGPLYQIRYLFGFGRHWTEGLPDHQPDLTDPDTKRAVEAGQLSIKIHQERIAAEQNEKKGRHAKSDDLPSLDDQTEPVRVNT